MKTFPHLKLLSVIFLHSLQSQADLHLHTCIYPQAKFCKELIFSLSLTEKTVVETKRFKPVDLTPILLPTNRRPWIQHVTMHGNHTQEFILTVSGCLVQTSFLFAPAFCRFLDFFFGLFFNTPSSGPTHS